MSEIDSNLSNDMGTELGTESQVNDRVITLNENDMKLYTFLNNLNLGAFVTHFKDHEINFEQLMKISLVGLQYCLYGVPYGNIMKLMEGIQNYRKETVSFFIFLLFYFVS